ncbi:serine/threonine protein kinase [Yasminevirus sp. GU-2018]|uniref:Serine/threonine protein kinase n=1 Tax=Yasminevirus sp. GU-2018 TaxID=2420051 RepID=A0A5K0U9H8_9VIRU|nr:serine/threonine protein kinase [Yasminevirus sp. GU-2018]
MSVIFGARKDNNGIINIDGHTDTDTKHTSCVTQTTQSEHTKTQTVDQTPAQTLAHAPQPHLSQPHSQLVNTRRIETKNKPIYMGSLQFGDKIELHHVFRKGRMCVSKKTKIGESGFVVPKFLREISVLRRLSNPPEHLKNHPGRDHIVKLLDVYVYDDYLHFDMERADGTLCDLKNIFNVSLIKEKILIDISNAVQYIHACGYNHCDISLNNIAYINLSNSDSINYKFVLIDFGNAVHKNRPFTVNSPTYYTASVEMARFASQMSWIESMLKRYFLSSKDSETINNTVTSLQKNFVHRKSDVWSLGALSYYLHNYDYYADGDTLEEQVEIILKREHESDILQKMEQNPDGHREILQKTKLMLIADHLMRPTMYFSNSATHSAQESVDTTTLSSLFDGIDESDKENPVDINMHLYETIVRRTIKEINALTKKANILNHLDEHYIGTIVRMCHKIESLHVQQILKTMSEEFNSSLKIPGSVVGLLCVIRVVIIWITMHIHFNNVWSIQEIARYLYMSKYVSSGDHNRIRTFIENICIIVCASCGWYFD